MCGFQEVPIKGRRRRGGEVGCTAMVPPSLQASCHTLPLSLFTLLFVLVSVFMRVLCLGSRPAHLRNITHLVLMSCCCDLFAGSLTYLVSDFPGVSSLVYSERVFLRLRESFYCELDV